MLEAIDLECERGGRKLFRDLSFTLGAGSLLRIAGANGSGKTSLLRILCGLLTPSAGEVRWQGEKIAVLKEDYSRSIVYLGHAPAVKDDFTAVENLEIACRLAGFSADARAALHRLGVPQDLPVRRLSQGQRRRAALARLVVSERAALWLLDEPYAALDPEGVATIDALIAAHAARGGAVLFTTHQASGVGAAQVIEIGARA